MLTIFRAVKKSDLEDVYQLALTSGFGLTTLPKNKAELALRIQRSISSFKKNPEVPFDENYLFVLEDLTTNKIIGTSAIEAGVGYDLPFYAYRVSKISNFCHKLGLRVEYNVLTLNNDFQGLTEIGTLYLDSKYRTNKNGLLLSRARFLFMAFAPERFANEVIAEMRGVSDKDGISPFWQSFGSHFFKISFAKADELSVLTDKQFIADLLPQQPVQTNLLSDDAQLAIGQPHKSTIPAMKILEKEGFSYDNYVDIFDAGPAIKAKMTEISTIKNLTKLPVVSINNVENANSYFISNTILEFRALKAQALINDLGVVLSDDVANALQVNIGDEIQLSKI